VAAGFTDWSASWPALGGYAIVAAAHLAGLARLPVRVPGRIREAAAFQSGLLLALLALVSPAGYWADRFLWIHALQFILLAVAATGLMVLGAPWQALRQAIRPRARPDREPVTAPVPGQSRAIRPRLPVRYPVAAIAVVNVIWAGWQLPALSGAARGNTAVALAYHLTIVAAGLLFWLQLIGSRPLTPAAPPLRRLALVVASVGVATIGGMVLVFGSAVLYPGYANQWHHVMTVLDDQQLSGAVFWMGMLPPLIVAAVALLTRWLGEEESADLSAGLDRLLTPRKNAWSARPGIR
jgi:putative membrane protein